MILARSIPREGPSKSWHVTHGRPAKRVRNRGPIIQEFNSLIEARAWLAERSDDEAAAVYLDYKPEDL